MVISQCVNPTETPQISHTMISYPCHQPLVSQLKSVLVHFKLGVNYPSFSHSSWITVILLIKCVYVMRAQTNQV